MRTRFAPSPTGMLHVGSLRTALYAWLVAGQTGGTFILRVEDTDREREVPGALENIVESLQWAGIEIDEGVTMKDGVIAQIGDKGPYIQSQRSELYKKHAEMLLEKGHAYRCFCTPQRLEQMRTEQQERKQAPMYDRQCLKLTEAEVQQKLAEGTPHVIRLKIPRDELIGFDDEVRGRVEFQGATIDDQVLLKSDGFPTYHLANVVDDRHMEIDIVIRGEEWLSSTPKHLLLFQYFGWQPPRYAHLPLLLNRDKSKLSKRQNSVSVTEYREKGYLPEVMINFLALLGWNPGTEKEIFSLQELIDTFSLERVQKAGAVFDLEKLDWLQGQWMRAIDAKSFADRIRPIVEEVHPAAKNDASFDAKAALIQDRITFFKEAPEMLGYFYEDPAVDRELIANKKQKVDAADVPKLLAILKDVLSTINEGDWTQERLEADLRAAVEANNLKLGQLLWPLRAVLTGRPFSPGAFEVAAQLGKEVTMRRIDKALS